MTKRRLALSFRRGRWAAIPGLSALVVGAVLLSAYSGASSSEGRAPDQPIPFPHPVHVQKLGMSCLYCHYAANKSPDPGMPAVSTCMGCHAFVGPDRPQSDVGPKRRSEAIAKLWQYSKATAFNTQLGAGATPIPWERIHKVPEYVRFPHMRHVNAGVSCQSCHGQIQNMNKVSQAASLNMGWCINCHVEGYDPEKGRQLTAGDPSQARAVEQQGANQPAGATPAGQAPVSGQAPGADQAPGTQSSATAGGRRRARYDCAVCHY